MNKKNRLFSFIFSLVPGLGHMYISLMRRGVSLLFGFCALFALSMYMQIGLAIYFLPVLWAYSFFDFWNLVRLDPEDFAGLEDKPVWGSELGLERMRYSFGVGIIVIIAGIYALIRSLSRFISELLPDEFYWWLVYDLPQMLVAVAMIVFGIWLIVHKKKRLDADKFEEDDFYVESVGQLAEDKSELTQEEGVEVKCQSEE